ncbi:MAG: hypothetical protein NTW13_03985, partial [Candidatus Omnitrophica bacterium]|nr:hypothetical protein [Candidatus Omnitrophota bacterium]
IARIRREYEDNLAQAASKAKAVIQEAHSEGREITAEIRKKAFEEAQDIIEAARKSVRHELAKAKEELKDEIIDLTLKATENIIQEKLTEEGDRRLVDNFLKTINTL